ncbi:MAG: CDP-diacylglycerol--glycerol-3-phosphate 3-phosphatidyltransferase [Oscillospiraceae bacterium]|jgi:CDP-diacylglycerol--glycerol-3-phosphate 3-phosphatidyltransferase|nr:CDP-diacylglycerol--glycerol-3-phosphate 3-phosphatidyltransferase [Oscillospiraceae bacterium]
MTTASIITLLRIALIPFFMVSQRLGWLDGYVALVIFILASLTDSLDGYVARRYNQISTFGKFIDPLADKLLVCSAILILVAEDILPAWIAMIILARDFIVTSLRLIAVGSGKVISAHLSGKVRTTVNVIFIVLYLSPIFHMDWWPGDVLDPTIQLTMAAVSIWSCIDYLARNWKVLDFKS